MALPLQGSRQHDHITQWRLRTQKDTNQGSAVSWVRQGW